MLKTFHVDYTSKQVPDLDIGIETNKNYGVLSLQVDGNDIECKTPILFHIMLDVSGSMSDIVSHNRTKMQLLKHTITNMIYYFAENTSHVFISVKGFDDRIHNYIEPTLVSRKNLNELLEKLDLIHPMQLTDIGLALETLKTDMEKNVEDVSNEQHVGILLTDGYPTVGTVDVNKLIDLVTPNKSYHFIALGNEHNANLMNKLGRLNSNTSNWFIDDIEHTGNVYGEIIFNEINKLYKDNIITIQNGTIYDYNGGCFSVNLHIGNLSKETKKEYHILVDDINECNIYIAGYVVDQNIPYTISASKNIPSVFNNIGNKLDDDNALFIIKQYFRLCVQKILFMIQKDLEDNCSNDNLNRFHFPIPIKFENHSYNFDEKLKLLKSKIIEFSDENNLQDDDFINGLLNDLNVAINSKGNKDQYKHIVARGDTQGKQTTFSTASQLEDDPIDFSKIRPPKLRRAPTSAYATPSRIELMREMSATDSNDNNDNNNNDDILSILTAKLPSPNFKNSINKHRLGTNSHTSPFMQSPPLCRQHSLSSDEELAELADNANN